MSSTSSRIQDHLDAVASVRDLETAFSIIAEHNFDADTKQCLLTLMRILDNVLQKPGNGKVRSIRLANAAFSSKVGSKKGGIEFLEACGFQKQTEPQLSSGFRGLGEEAAATKGDDHLVLLPQREATKHLVLARRLLSTRAVQDLGLKPEELPVYRDPPPPINLDPPVSHSKSATTADSFNPYVGHRHDGLSAAVGESLGPPSNYVSSTETELQRLKQQRDKLTAKQPSTLDPSWKAFRPNEAVVLESSKSSTAKQLSDSALVSARLQRQQAAAQQRQQFTTKAMRDLAAIKNSKVYSTTQLTIQFPDGHKLLGQFLPSSTIQHVIDSLVQQLAASSSFQNLSLYITPPRRDLDPAHTLQHEGLVPAAKVFVKSNKGSTALSIRPELFGRHGQQAAFPTGMSIVPTASNQKEQDDNKKRPAATSAPKRESREDAMLRKMLGKK